MKAISILFLTALAAVACKGGDPEQLNKKVDERTAEQSGDVEAANPLAGSPGLELVSGNVGPASPMPNRILATLTVQGAPADWYKFVFTKKTGPGNDIGFAARYNAVYTYKYKCGFANLSVCSKSTTCRDARFTRLIGVVTYYYDGCSGNPAIYAWGMAFEGNGLHVGPAGFSGNLSNNVNGGQTYKFDGTFTN